MKELYKQVVDSYFAVFGLSAPLYSPSAFDVAQFSRERTWWDYGEAAAILAAARASPGLHPPSSYLDSHIVMRTQSSYCIVYSDPDSERVQIAIFHRQQGIVRELCGFDISSGSYVAHRTGLGSRCYRWLKTSQSRDALTLDEIRTQLGGKNIAELAELICSSPAASPLSDLVRDFEHKRSQCTRCKASLKCFAEAERWSIPSAQYDWRFGRYRVQFACERCGLLLSTAQEPRGQFIERCFRRLSFALESLAEQHNKPSRVC